MTSRARWGALLSASLLHGCKPADAPPSPPGAPAPSASAPEASPPEIRLGKPLTTRDLKDVLPGSDVLPEHLPLPGRLHPQAPDLLPIPGTYYPTLSETIRYGMGKFHISYHDTSPCPLPTLDPPCALFSISPPVEAPGEREWAGGGLRPERPPHSRLTRRIAPRRWQSVSGGRSAIFALSPADGAIDRIDDQGNVTAFVADKRLAQWDLFWAFEQGRRVWFVGQGRVLEVAEAVETEPGQPLPRRLSAATELGMTHLRQGKTAQDARRALQGKPRMFDTELDPSARLAGQGGLRVMASEPRFVPLGSEEQGRWGMAWLEVIPPPIGSPPVGSPPAGSPRGADDKAKNGCSRYGPSRPLTDPSVDKKAHFTVFQGSAVVSDSTLWSKPELDPSQVSLRASVQGETPSVEVEHRSGDWRSASLKFPGAPREEARAERDESLVAASFDAPSGEGLVLVRRDKRLFFRRFDRDGKWLLEAAPYRHSLPREKGSTDTDAWRSFFGAQGSAESSMARSLLRAGEAWFALVGDAVLPLSGGTPPQRPQPPEHTPAALALIDGKPTLLTRFNGFIHAVRLDAEGKASSPPRKLAPAPPGWSDRNNLWVARPPGRPPLLGLQTLEYRPERRRSAGALSLGPGASWSWPLALGFSDDRPRSISFVSTPTDLIALVDDNPVQAVWLGSGKVTSTPVPAGNPLIVPPEQPGPVAALPGMGDAGRLCPRVILTGGPSALLVCTSGTDLNAPGTKVSLRRLPGGSP